MELTLQQEPQNKLKSNGLPWEKAKAFDGSTLIGSWFDKTKFQDLRNEFFIK